jgi:tetratricopeptide (TPR) repeat protein
MTLSLVDREGRSTIAAAEGQAALAAGDTARAREKYAEAGAILEQQLPNVWKQSEKNLVRFLAASQYYHGGHYRKALALCEQIQPRLLPRTVRHLFPAFHRDAKARSTPEYERGVRVEMKRLWVAKQHGKILEMLQEHPYVLPPGWLAFLRAVACEELRDYRAAALFYADAVRSEPGDAGLVATVAALPLTLPAQGRLEEAWEYVRHLLELLPHPVTYMAASVVCFHRASKAEGEERRRLLEEQVGYFYEAWRTYRDLPHEQQNHPDLRAYMALCLEAAALGLRKLGDKIRGLEVCKAAIDFSPDTPGPWTARGIMTYPSNAAVADFQKAVSLGDMTYFPYYYLAHDALTRSDFREGLSQCEEALRRDPSRSIEAQLYGWMAICLSHLGASPGEADRLFRMALEADPGNEEIASNYRNFRSSLEPRRRGTQSAWHLGQLRGDGEQLLLRHAARLGSKLDPAAPVQRRLQEAVA